MKYVALFIAILLAFIAGSQISSANGMVAAPAVESGASLTDAMASEYLVSDTANRMMAFHKAYKH